MSAWSNVPSVRHRNHSPQPPLTVSVGCWFAKRLAWWSIRNTYCSIGRSLCAVQLSCTEKLQSNALYCRIWLTLTNINIWLYSQFLFALRQRKSFDFSQITAFHQLLPVDGLWIDMNEISNFCSGECSNNDRWRTSLRGGRRPSRVLRSVKFDPNNPPYHIHNQGSQNTPLNSKTLDMDARHYNGTLEYNAHNLYGVLLGYTVLCLWE